MTAVLRVLDEVGKIEDALLRARGKFEALTGAVGSAEAAAMTHDELEEQLFREGNELLRNLMQAHLDARQGGKVAAGRVDGADGVVRDDERDLTRNLETRFGTVKVKRTGYAAEGHESLVPLDGALNLPDQKYSFTLQRKVAEGAAKGPFDDVVESIVADTGARIPKRQAEELAVATASDFAAFYETRHDAAQKAHRDSGPIVVISTDGVGVRVIGKARRDPKMRARPARTKGLLERLSPGEKPGLARMATVATVYTIAQFVRDPLDIVGERDTPPPKRPKPEHKRVWASVTDDAEKVIAAAFEEACYRDPTRKKKRWVVLLDGNLHQLDVAERLAKDHNVDITLIVDIYHVSEYVWKAANVLSPDDKTTRQQWVAERLHQILCGRAVHVAAGIRRSATLRRLKDGDRRAVDACADYLLSKQQYLRYNEYLADGLPIATGVIEGAGRHLVNDRMDIAGARWGLETAEAVLQLRSLRSSGDFDAYWDFHVAAEHRRNHAAKYAGDAPPPPVTPPQEPKKPRKPALRLVKS